MFLSCLFNGKPWCADDLARRGDNRAAEFRLRTKRGARIHAELADDYGDACMSFRNMVEMTLRIIELERRERADAHS